MTSDCEEPQPRRERAVSAAAASPSGHSSVKGLPHIHRWIKQKLQRKRRIERDELPLEQPRLRKREVIDIAPRRGDAVAFKHDQNTRLVGTGIILTDDARLP